MTGPNIKCTYSEIVDITTLKPHPRNRNRHPKKQIQALAEIVRHQGWRRSITVSDRSGYMTAGHGRLLVAEFLHEKYPDEKWNYVPVDRQAYDSEEQEYEDLTADNAIALWAELDIDKIKLDVLDMPKLDLSKLGIKKLELVAGHLRGGDGNAMPTEIPQRCDAGDVWAMDGHRLVCGDSTDLKSYKHMEKPAEICFTSPPYNLGDNSKLRGHNARGKDSAYNDKSDHRGESDYFEFLRTFTELTLDHCRHSFVNIQALANNKVAIAEYWHHFREQLTDVMIWDKGHGAPQMSPRVLNCVFEFIFIFSNESPANRAIKTGPGFHGTEQNVFRLGTQGTKDELAKSHGAVFPVEFAEHFIGKFSTAGEIILDPFGGSGTTLIAAERLGRWGYLIELDPRYCDIIIARWEKFTGRKAEKLNVKK